MDLENILWTLLPLITLIVISWILSFMGSKVAKKRQEEQVMKGETHGDRSDELFMDMEGDEEFEPARPDRPDGIDTDGIDTTGPDFAGRGQSSQWGSLQELGPGTPTPKPIKPKWWGA